MLTTQGEMLAGHGEDLTAIKAKPTEQGKTLASHGRQLDEILRLLRHLTGGAAEEPGQE